jgi:FlaA1/EpsC-like NDP-sugar epimerase
MISSDKAVNPTSIMGVTKRVAELVVQEAARRTGNAYVVVRFGNVLGSRGSVVPILKEQILRGGPVTITHPDASRFFMTIPEAVHLVLQAGAMGSSGETYVLDMGQPIRIIDLARDLIRLSGLQEGTDIDIAITGLKAGEKLHEELFYEDEKAERSSNEKIFVCRNGHGCDGGEAFASLQDQIESSEVSQVVIEKETFPTTVERLVHSAEAGDAANIYQLLKQLVPQFRMPADERIPQDLPA